MQWRKRAQAKEIKITRRGISKMMVREGVSKVMTFWEAPEKSEDLNCDAGEVAFQTRRNSMCKIRKWEETWCIQTPTRWPEGLWGLSAVSKVATVKEFKFTSGILDFVLSLMENYLKDAEQCHALIWLTYLKG